MATPNSGNKRHHKKGAFLASVATCGNVSAAARISKVSRESHRRWMENDPEYPARFNEAMEEAGDYLEAEARRRGFAGVDTPVFQGGHQCGTIRKYSDTLLIFLLKGAKPAKYRERYDIETTGKSEITVLVKHDRNFFGNADRLPTGSNGTSAIDLTESGPPQTGRLGSPGGENGHGSNGNGAGPRA